MIRTTSVLVFAAALPFLAAAPTQSERIRFAPAEGTVLTKTFESKVRLALDDYQIEGPAAAAPPRLEQTFVTNQQTVVTDEYVKNREGAPLVLKRSFDEIASERSMTLEQDIMGQTRSNEQNMRGKSELVGKKVVFTWDPDKATYKRAFDPSLDRDELLAGLQEDMDLRGLLPAGDVQVGDQWDIELKGLVAILAPGGNLSIVSEQADAKSIAIGAQAASTMATIGDKLEGVAKAKLTAVREESGTRLAAIQLEIRVRSSNDMTDTMQKMLEEIDLPPDLESMEIASFIVDYSLESEGEFLWDLTAGHFRSLELSGTSTVKLDQKAKIGVNGRKIEVRETREMSGTSSLGAKAQ